MLNLTSNLLLLAAKTLSDNKSGGSGFEAFDGLQKVFNNMGRIVFSFINVLQRNIWIPVLFIIAIAAVAIIGGRKGVEFAKTKLFYVIASLLIIVNIAIIASALVTMVGGDSSGLNSMAEQAKQYAANQSAG